MLPSYSVSNLQFSIFLLYSYLLSLGGFLRLEAGGIMVTDIATQVQILDKVICVSFVLMFMGKVEIQSQVNRTEWAH